MARLLIIRRLLQCLGVASVLLVMNYGDLLGGGSDVRLHVPFPLGGIVLAQIADIVLLGVGLFLLLLFTEGTRASRWTRLVLAAGLPLLLAAQVHAAVHSPLSLLAVVSAAGWAVVLPAVFLLTPNDYRLVLLAADKLGIVLAVFALCSLLQLGWLGTWHPGPYERVAAWNRADQPPRDHPLVVWIVFDELSYDQLFEHRAPGLQLPSFDALRAESTLFPAATPVGYHTDRILPSLLSGDVVDQVHYTFDDRFLIHLAGAHGWQRLTGSGTIFHDAQQAGWRTAAVGWYNPYCTLSPRAIDDCYWMNLDSLDGRMSQRRTFWQNTVQPLDALWQNAATPARGGSDTCSFDVRQRQGTYTDLSEHALRLLRTDQADFVFLHMPVPHSPNIWNRSQSRFASGCGGSYLDSLALADRMLGQVLETLHASPRWRRTTLIVQGDHGWRVALWNRLPAWTAEDRKASRGIFDPRPALIVHSEGQSSPEVISTPWPLLRVHHVLETLLATGGTEAFRQAKPKTP